jgi:hypothetical protein
MDAEVTTNLSSGDLDGLATARTPVIASVHHWLRWPYLVPPTTGGHLVLVTGASCGFVRLRNPSGLPGWRGLVLHA